MSEALHPASFRDRSGFVFSLNDQVFRQVNRSCQKHYEKLMASGLYQELVKNDLLIAHTEIPPDTSSGDMRDAQDAWLWLKPVQLDFISYPYEWCFSQLQEAALTTLQVQQCAVRHGMTLKDSSAFNIQFRNGRAIFIDTLSFEEYQPGQPWTAYRQFCEHFLAPLALMSKCHHGLNSMMALHIDGIPLELATALLPTSSWLDPHMAIHLHLHKRFQQKYKDTSVDEYQDSKKGASVKIADVVESLKIAVNSLALPKRPSQWSEYYAQSSYTDESMILKEKAVESMLSESKAQSVIDFGANTGRFSQIAAKTAARVISLDLDPLCVENLFLECKKQNNTKIQPLIIDLCNPTPGVGWNNTERTSFTERAEADCGLALALIHHLHVSGHIPMDKISAFFASMVRDLIIEFVPLEDPQTKRLLVSRQSNFPDYTESSFENSFLRHFTIKEKVDLQNNQRVLYHLRSTLL